MNTLSALETRNAAHAQNTIAAVLSAFAPGLGQAYKGHVASGLLWLFLGMPMAIWIGILLSLATAGLGLLFPVACWVTLVIDAYYEKDLRHHHPLPSIDVLFAVEQD